MSISIIPFNMNFVLRGTGLTGVPQLYTDFYIVFSQRGHVFTLKNKVFVAPPSNNHEPPSQHPNTGTASFKHRHRNIFHKTSQHTGGGSGKHTNNQLLAHNKEPQTTQTRTSNNRAAKRNVCCVYAYTHTHSVVVCTIPKHKGIFSPTKQGFPRGDLFPISGHDVFTGTGQRY